MFDKILRYFIAKILVNSGIYKHGLMFTEYSRDAEIIYDFIMKNKKIRDTEKRPVKLEEVCNG